MRQGRNWMERFADGMDLPGQPLPGQPIVELAGAGRVLIENHRGVTQYSGESICIRVSYGHVNVSGQGLVLSRMTREQLIISGSIDEIKIIRR